MTTNNDAEEAPAIPWQTSEAQVGGFAYSEGPVKKARSAVSGFVYMEGRGPKSKSIASLDPSWQTALVTVEGFLDNARSIVRQHRRTFHFRDPFGEACAALNGSWIPMVNQRLQGTGYSVDCTPVAALQNSTRIHYIFIRINITLAAKVAAVPPPPKPLGVAGGVPPLSPSSSRTSSTDLYERKLYKKKTVDSGDGASSSNNKHYKEGTRAVSSAPRGMAVNPVVLAPGDGGGRAASSLDLYERRLARKGMLSERKSNKSKKEEAPPKPLAHGAIAVTPGEGEVPRIPPSPSSSRTSSTDLYERKLGKKSPASGANGSHHTNNSREDSLSLRRRRASPLTTNTTVDPLAPHPAVSDEYLRQEASYRNLVQQLEDNTKPARTNSETAELEQELRKERMRTAVQAIQIEQLGEQLNEQTARSTIQGENMEDLISQLREERLHNEEQAETISGLERRLKEALAELDVLRCHLSLDTSTSTHASEVPTEVLDKDGGAGGEKKHKKHKKHKKKKVELERSKSKRHKKKKEKKFEQEDDSAERHEKKTSALQDDGIALHDAYEVKEQPHVREPSAPKENSEKSGDTDDLSTSSNPTYPPPFLAP